MRNYSVNDTISLALDIIGEMPSGIKEEVEEYRGAPDYTHKTGADIMIFKTSAGFNNYKQATARRGQSSILRMQMDGAGRTQAKAL